MVETFNPKTCTLKLQDGKMVKIDEEDVELTLGLKRGKVKISTKKRLKVKTPCVQLWREDFQDLNENKKPTAVMACKRMGEFEDGGHQFVRHFLVAFNSTIVESTQAGDANERILEAVDGEELTEINWCNYLMKKLIENVKSAQKGHVKYFRGPLLLLMVHLFIRMHHKRL